MNTHKKLRELGFKKTNFYRPFVRVNFSHEQLLSKK